MLEILILLTIGSYVLCEPLPINSFKNEDLGIVGGFEGNIEDFPYQASFEYDGGHFCGATIIHRSILVTAAHCTFGKVAERMAIRVGSSYRGSDGQLVRVKHVETNPSFSFAHMDSDVAILWLEHPLELGPKVQVIKLAEQNELLETGTKVVVSGWGMMEPTIRVLSLKLKYLFLQVTDYESCNVLYFGRITKNMLCAGTLGRKESPCMGDSGGPLVADNTLVGIVSWGVGCNTYLEPGIFTNVRVVKPWIDLKIKENAHLLE